MHDRRARPRAIGRRSRCEQRRGKLLPDVARPSSACAWRSRSFFCATSSVAGIDRREVARLRLAVEVVRRHGEAMPVRTTADANGRARHELRLEPRLVEPRRLDLARLVRDARGEDLQPPAPAARRGADDAFDDGLLVAEEIADPLRRNGLLVPARTLPEQIADRREAELRRADARSSGRRPASDSTGASSSSGLGADRGRGQRSGASTPPKPTGSAVRASCPHHGRS